MEDLLKDYLEKGHYNYNNVYVLAFIENGHLCEVQFNHDDSEYSETLNISLWGVMAYVNSEL